MHHGTAGEIERALLEQEAGRFASRFGRRCIGVGVRASPVPDHVGHRDVGQREPDHHEDQDRGELGAFGEGADDQAAGNRRKCPLENHEGQFGDADTLGEGCAYGIRRHTFQKELVEHAEERVALGKRRRVAVNHPEHGDQREDREHLHQHREHVLGTDQAAIEQSEAGNRHQDDQGGADHQPGVVTLVDLENRCCGYCGRYSLGSHAAYSGHAGHSHRGGNSAQRRSNRCFFGKGRGTESDGADQCQQCEYAFHDSLLRVHRHRFRRYGCERPVRGRKQRSCRHRSCRCWPISRWLR